MNKIDILLSFAFGFLVGVIATGFACGAIHLKP